MRKVDPRPWDKRVLAVERIVIGGTKTTLKHQAPVKIKGLKMAADPEKRVMKKNLKEVRVK